MQELVYPTNFTLEQLQRLQQLTQEAYAREHDPHDHNLARKIGEYLRNARSAVGIAYFARSA